MVIDLRTATTTRAHHNITKEKNAIFLTVFYSDHLINNMTKNRFRLQTP